ncbi:MAG: hypothetical protein WC374_06410 [Phycisphaerae bacterium]|jgi:hypothetical protein
MSREISIIIRARNAMAAGLSSAGKSLQAFGSSAVRIGAFFVKGFLAAGAAVAGFTAKAISAYAGQEAAGRALAGALNAQGEAGEALLPYFRKIASAIQDQTGADDDAVIAGMAKMRMLGVQTSKLGEAAKGVIALKGVGLEEAAAQKAVAMAMQGNYDMLNRYVPALRSATSESEKAQIVNELFAKGYDQQAQQLDTVSGQWNLLKGRVGDAWEEIGAAIAQNDQLMSVLKRAGEAVKEFGNKVAEWVTGGGTIRLIANFKLFYNEASHIFRLIGNTAAITWAAMGDGADTLVNNIVAGFKYSADYAAAAWKKIRHPFSKFEPPDKAKYAFGIVTALTEKALADREKIHKDYANRVEEISEQESKGLIKQEEKVAKAKADAAEAEKKLAEEVTNIVEKESKKQVKARMAALKTELSELNRRKQLWEGLAKTRVQDYIKQQQEAKEIAKEKAKEDERAKRLEASVEKGARLGKKDQEFLDAYRKISGAKDVFAKLKDAGKTVEGQIKMAEDTLKVQEDIRDSLGNIEDSLEKNLAY